jgi:hypothetical protein
MFANERSAAIPLRKIVCRIECHSDARWQAAG